MGQPKRVWSNNKTVWDGKKSVWLQDGELKTYNGNWEDPGSDLQTYGSQWEEVSEDAILDVYDSNTPEPIGTPEDGIEATYTFKDYDGTVLKTGKVKDGETPVAPADPTREHYTFQGWNPTVGPISKNTEFVAVFVWDPPAPERCPASIQDVWGNDATIEVGQTAAVITKFTTTAECENVDYSNIVAYVRASYNVPSDVATASIDFNENKVYVTGVKAGECTVVFTDGDRSWSNNVTVVEPSYTFTINAENLPEGAFMDNGEEPFDFPTILDIPSGGSFNGNCISRDGDGDLNVTIWDTPDGSSEGVENMLTITCGGYKPSFEAVGFDLEDNGGGSYNFKKGDNYQIAPDSDVSLIVSFTPVE